MAEAKLDEEFACKLPRDHLAECGVSRFQCTVNVADPPDLVVTWDNDIQWGVEVTRTYQQVTSFDGKQQVSSEQIGADLRNFAERLRENTKNTRKRSYTIFLEGPSRFSSWKKSASKKEWEEETEKAIWQHIVSDKRSPLKVPGVWLRPSELGQRWTIAISSGSGAAETSWATTRMVRRTLGDKTEDLSRWSGSFAERWLLLLNFYPQAEDPSQVEEILRRLVFAHPDVLAGFDGIFYSNGYPCDSLDRISLRSSGG